jgi:acetylornithine aminotransferase
MKNIIWSTGHPLKFENIVDSDNCFLYDTNGNQFVDLESGVWCTSIGHNNKRVNNVIANQISKISHTGFCFCHPQIDKTAEKLLKISGLTDGKCEFLCSGSEAVEFGMRVARAVSKKPFALTFSDSYFGAYGDASAKDKSNWYMFDWLNCSCNNTENSCTGECADFQKIPFDQIGVFLFEPGSSSGLVRFPSPQLIQKIVSKINESDGILMINEITTGIGRTGKWFGYQHYKIQPDIVALGKGLGNGYPVSATVISKKVAENLEKSNFKYAQSHQNDPLGAFVASEIIDIIWEEGLIEKCCKKGEYLKEKLIALKRETSLIKEVRGRGLMIAIELKKNSLLVFEELLKLGFITAKRPNAEVLRIDPALTIERPTIDLFLKALSETLDKTNS